MANGVIEKVPESIINFKNSTSIFVQVPYNKCKMFHIYVGATGPHGGLSSVDLELLLTVDDGNGATNYSFAVIKNDSNAITAYSYSNGEFGVTFKYTGFHSIVLIPIVFKK